MTSNNTITQNEWHLCEKDSHDLCIKVDELEAELKAKQVELDRTKAELEVLKVEYCALKRDNDLSKHCLQTKEYNRQLFVKHIEAFMNDTGRFVAKYNSVPQYNPYSYQRDETYHNDDDDEMPGLVSIISDSDHDDEMPELVREITMITDDDVEMPDGWYVRGSL